MLLPQRATDLYLARGRLRFVAATARAAAVAPGRVGSELAGGRLRAAPGFEFATALSAAFAPGRV